MDRQYRAQSRELTIETGDDFFDEHHGDDDDDQPDEAVKYALEPQAVTESEAESFQDHEFRAEQDQPGGEEFERLPSGADFVLKESKDAVLRDEGQFQQDLQQERGTKCGGERHDVNLAGIFGEEPENSKIDQRTGEKQNE